MRDAALLAASYGYGRSSSIKPNAAASEARVAPPIAMLPSDEGLGCGMAWAGSSSLTR